MKNIGVTHSGKTVVIGGRPIEMEYPVVEAFQLGDKVVVMLDPDAYNQKFGQFRNLLAFTPEGEALWVAELPTSMSSDTYTRISSKNPLVADSFTSYACEINQSSGEIIKKSFYK